MSRRFDEGLTFLGGAVEGAIRGWRDGQNDKMKRAELTAKMRAYEEDRKHKLIQDEIQARKAGFIIDRDGEGGVVVGVAAGGGPMGAMAGYNIGSGVGRMSGG